MSSKQNDKSLLFKKYSWTSGDELLILKMYCCICQVSVYLSVQALWCERLTVQTHVCLSFSLSSFICNLPYFSLLPFFLWYSFRWQGSGSINTQNENCFVNKIRPFFLMSWFTRTRRAYRTKRVCAYGLYLRYFSKLAKYSIFP